ncbi:hypothetical protein I3843_16G046700 [Carya illinoinensis]|nr:hypothetical protein I3843_16G046700 [Carya illinoinensis]
MATADGGTGRPSFADLVATVPQPIPETSLPFRTHKLLDGEVYFQFSREKISNFAEPFRYSVILKFLKQRPSLDAVRSFIHNRWGLSTSPIASSMRRPSNVFVRMANDADFTKALCRDVCEINGIPYRAFRWTPDFTEDEEPSKVPVWISLPGLPPNFYCESFLNILMASIGTFIRWDNPMRCARTDGARLCVEVDAAKELLGHFWIGAPRLSSSRKQEVVYEALPAYCCKCHMQGHKLRTCRAEQIAHTNKARVEVTGQKGMKTHEDSVDVHGMKENPRAVSVINHGAVGAVGGHEEPVAVLEKEPNVVGAVEVLEINAKAILDHNADPVGAVGLNDDPIGVARGNEELVVVLEVEPSVEQTGISLTTNGVEVDARAEELPAIGVLPNGVGLVKSGGERVAGSQVDAFPIFFDPVNAFTLAGDGISDSAVHVLIAQESELADPVVAHEMEVVVGAPEGGTDEANVFLEDTVSEPDPELHPEANGGKIWIFGDSIIEVRLVRMGRQFISLKVGEGAEIFLLTIIYAKCTMVERRSLWDALSFQNLDFAPCIFVGDFNIIRNDSEHRRGRSQPIQAM